MNLTIGLFLFSLAFSTCANAKQNNENNLLKRRGRSPETRVFGGSQALENKYKFVIFSLYMKEDYSLQKCSGVLIKADWALFPAHCFGSCPSPRNSSVILAGGNADLSDYFEERTQELFNYDIDGRVYGIQERRAKYVYVHEGYYFKASEFDIALVRTSKPFDIKGMLQVVPISNSEIKSNPSCTIVGYKSEVADHYNYWGYLTTMSTKVEMYVDDVIVLEECRSKKKDFICIEGGKYRYTCREHFALICDGKVWGIATKSNSSLTCDETEEDYLTELNPYTKWIEETIAKAKGVVLFEVQKNSGTTSDFVIIALISGVCFFFFWFIIFMILSKNRKWCFANNNIVEPAYSSLLAYSSEDDDEDVVVDKTKAMPADENV